MPKSRRIRGLVSSGLYQRAISSFGKGLLAIPPSEIRVRARAGKRKDWTSRKSPPGVLLAADRRRPWTPGG
ncbi:hypothetical protein ACTAF0_10045 [Streptomyces murinus]|uniref:hypothetical protein n=1 Tax=Streptomyces murinus TaxID=33900 RepID=UPI003F48C986